MARAVNPGRGLRKFDQASAMADAYSERFDSLRMDASPGKVLLALKRSASYQRFPLRVITLIDLLFSWTKPQDWQSGGSPIVWPSNALLAEKLGIGVRQVQNILKQAQQLGLITFRDSPNGHRGGQRDPNGRLRWAYGIVLAPIGARYEEFVRVAEEGAAKAQEIGLLKRRLKACRRKMRELVQTVIDNALPDGEATRELALVHMATAQLKSSTDLELLRSCVEQMEERERGFNAKVREALESSRSSHTGVQKIASKHETDCTHILTTNQLQTAKAVTGSCSAMSSSRGSVAPSAGVATDVEADLETHGVTPSFLAEVAPDLCADLLGGDRPWGVVVATAERLTSQHQISLHAWREACRVMGQKGAAASVIATVQKFRSGEVRKPGAYLRGMSGKAARGELHLGRTMHGLKDLNREGAVRTLTGSPAALSIGAILRGRAGSGISGQK